MNPTWGMAGGSATSANTASAVFWYSAPKRTATAAVLIPSRDKQTSEGHRDQAQNNAAEQGFDHDDASAIRIKQNSLTGTSAL